MDPTASLANAANSIRIQDYHEALSHLDDYWAWRMQNGGQPFSYADAQYILLVRHCLISLGELNDVLL